MVGGGVRRVITALKNEICFFFFKLPFSALELDLIFFFSFLWAFLIPLRASIDSLITFP